MSSCFRLSSVVDMPGSEGVVVGRPGTSGNSAGLVGLLLGWFGNFLENGGVVVLHGAHGSSEIGVVVVQGAHGSSCVVVVTQGAHGSPGVVVGEGGTVVVTQGVQGSLGPGVVVERGSRVDVNVQHGSFKSTGVVVDLWSSLN